MGPEHAPREKKLSMVIFLDFQNHEKSGVGKKAFFSLFLMRKRLSSGQKWFLSISISWNLILYTFSCTKIKKIAMDNFFLLMHVILIHSNSPGSLWVLLLSFYVFVLLSFCHSVSMSLGTLSRRKKWFLSGVARNDFFYTYLNSPTVHCSKQSQTICSCLQKRNRWKSHLGRLFQKQQEFLNDNTDHIYDEWSIQTFWLHPKFWIFFWKFPKPQRGRCLLTSKLQNFHFLPRIARGI